ANLSERESRWIRVWRTRSRHGPMPSGSRKAGRTAAISSTGHEPASGSPSSSRAWYPAEIPRLVGFKAGELRRGAELAEITERHVHFFVVVACLPKPDPGRRDEPSRRLLGDLRPDDNQRGSDGLARHPLSRPHGASGGLAERQSASS